MKRLNHSAAAAVLVLAAGLSGAAQAQSDGGLLFRMSADGGFVADAAQGDPHPTFVANVSRPDTGGARGGYIRGTDDQAVAWRAPGNMLAQRGSLAFNWRPQYAVGPTEFVLFRAGYADHSSWDMTFLRIDWNGGGFDAFVTDANLARVRVSYKLPRTPAPDAWMHLAFTWDETTGVRLYVDGVEAARNAQPAVLDAALDQFGIAGRIVSPIQVHSRYNFTRASDYDEMRIYDHALAASDVAALARNGEPVAAPAVAGTARTAWDKRFGFEGAPPPYLADPVTRIRRVEFTEQRDVAQRMWKGNDGVRETTWPGVYNRSRLAGRSDYFILPDWDVYSMSGKAATWFLPDEPWNQVEIQGAAYGRLETVQARIEGPRVADSTRPVLLANRARGAERTTIRTGVQRGGAIRFINTAQETPIQEIGAYNVTAGVVPESLGEYRYTVRADAEPSYVAVDGLTAFIAGRYPRSERGAVVALPATAPQTPRTTSLAGTSPIAHVLVPVDFRRGRSGGPLIRNVPTQSFQQAGGLDGIVLEIPALKARPGRGGLIPLNIRVKDPTWPLRDLLDVNVSVRPDEARTVFLDTRDRVLDDDHSLYLTVASSAPDFNAASLDGMGVRLIFKGRDAARPEHVADRSEQIRETYGFLVEERQVTRDLAMFDRFFLDLTDLLRVDPDNVLGRAYWSEWNGNQPLPAFVQPTPPTGAPLWAFRQVESLRLVRQFVNWWIDNRQVEGELGGGISDDTDLTNQWVGPALMGVDPDKFNASILALIDASYRDGMWTDGLGAIQTDELHTYEEGINVIAQAALLNRGDPLTMERLMATARRYADVTQVNAAGHRHFVSNNYSGSRIARDTPFDWSKSQSNLVLHPGMLLVDYNGSPQLRSLLLELADGYIAHGAPWPADINWTTDAQRGTGLGPTAPLLWNAWRWTGDARYLAPFQTATGLDPTAISTLNSDLARDLGRPELNGRYVQAAGQPGASDEALTIAAMETGERGHLERLYAKQIHSAAVRMDMQTVDQWWTDRVEVPSDQLQRARLGGVAHARNRIVPGNRISWRFADPEDALRVAVLVQEPSQTGFRVVVWNLADRPVRAEIAGGQVTPGRWRLVHGVDADGDDRADGGEAAGLDFGPGQSTAVTLPPGASVLEFALATAGPAMNTRPDVGLGRGDVMLDRGGVRVTVHGLGSVASPGGRAVLETASGQAIAEARFGPLQPPNDLRPKTTRVRLSARDVPEGARVRLILDGSPAEVSETNNMRAVR